MSFSQLWGITYYEFRMHWRRRALIVLTLAMLFITFVSILLISDAFTSRVDDVDDDGETRSITVEEATNYLVVFSTWTSVGLVLAFILPIVVADTIPLDKQLGTRELLDSLPLTASTYLLGKTLGLWLAMASSLLIIMVLAGLGWAVRVGGFDASQYAKMWVFGALPLLILNGGLGVLLMSGQSNRRRAVLTMVAVFLPLIFLFGVGGSTSIWVYVNPLRWPILSYFMDSPSDEIFNMGDYSFSLNQVMLSIGVGAVELMTVGLMAWGWMRYQANRI